MDKIIEELFKSVSDEIKKAKDEAYDEGFKHGLTVKDRRINQAYKKGLNDAWGYARKIGASTGNGGLSLKTVGDIFGTTPPEVLGKYSVDEVITKIKEYEGKHSQINCNNCKHKIDTDEIHGYTPCGNCVEFSNFELKQSEKNCDNCGANCASECDGYSHWKPKQTDEQIKVGDEVINSQSISMIVMEIIGDFYVGLTKEFKVACCEIRFAKKTGRHFAFVTRGEENSENDPK